MNREVLPPAVPYREFVSLERQALESDETRNFWKENLSDSVATPLPRWDSPKGGAQVTWVPIPVSSDVSDALKKITQTTGIPIKDVLLAVHMKVMSLLAGQRDVITGLISNGRPEMTDGESMVGLFLNTLPFRMKLPAGSCIDLAGKVFEDGNRDTAAQALSAGADSNRSRRKVALRDGFQFHAVPPFPGTARFLRSGDTRQPQSC